MFHSRGGGLAVFLLAVLGLLLSRPAFASYIIIDLGTLGGSNSYAYAINASGQVAGYAEDDNGNDHAFRYSNGQMQDLLTLGGDFSYAYGINDSGQVAGYSYTTDNAAIHAFFYDGTTMNDLMTLGGDASYANALNNSGQVVGTSDTDDSSTPPSHAFLYESSTLNDLLTLGGSFSTALAINDSGQVAGYSNTMNDAAQHAFFYDGTTMHDLMTLGGAYSYAYGINASGQIVGHSYITGNKAEHAFFYDGTTMNDLMTLGGNSSFAYSINASGQIVGDSDTATAGRHAFLYSNGTMIDLNTQIPANSGWTLTNAEGINDLGQIVGYGLINGNYHAYLLTQVIRVSGTITLQSCVNPAQSISFEFRPTGGGSSFTQTVVLNTDGTFSLSGIPVGSYNLAIKGSKWLQQVISVDGTSGDVSGVTATLLAGDVNGDNQVSLADYVLLRNAFGSKPSSSHWNANADLNCDGQISLADYVLLRNNFGKKGDS